MPRHILTPEEGIRGSHNSVLSRRAAMRISKQLARMGIEKEMITQILGFAKSLVMTPIGSIVISWFIIDLAQKTKYIDWEEGVALKALITGDAILGALGGGQGIAGVVGSLASAVK